MIKKKIGFKGPSCFYKNIKDGCTTLAKVEKDPPKTKFDINEILKGRYKSKDQQSAKKISKPFTNHKEWLCTYLTIILNLHLRLNIDQFMEKDWKYWLLNKQFKDCK